MRNVRRPFLFEVAWEVANKVGGIYTVIKTKVPVTVQEYTNERYFLIGPLSYKYADLEVEKIPLTRETIQSEQLQDVNRHLKEALLSMQERGVHVLFGKWLIESSPYVVLFDLNSVRHRLSEWRGDIWQKAGLPSTDHDHELNDAILFGYLVAWFLGEFSHKQKKNAILAHFHEWMASCALLLIKNRCLDVCTLFTTHATLLGRYLCAGSVDFYNSLHHFDVDYEAGKRGIYGRYCLERGAAHCADVFTTVSHITAYEAEHLLKRKADGVVPNGLNAVKFSAMHEFQNLHSQFKQKIHEFVRGHFYGHINFDLDYTLYLFTSGRYEYRNKGVDMFLESLARVNQQLKHINSPITIVAFIIMPAATHSFSVDALKGQAVMKQLRDTVGHVQENIGKRVFEACSRGQLPVIEELLTEEEIIFLKRRIFSLKRDSLPPIVTHNMADDSNDPILNQIRRLGLYNNLDDRVKVVFHPEFLNSNSALFGMDYEDFVRGCHLGVFPSYYEPWGYTPAECTVMGVPSITTNLSGFGCFMEENIENPADYGIYIVDRRMKSIEESIQQLTDIMLQFTQKSRRQRINQRNRTERLSDILDWQRMGLEYVKARHLALKRRFPEAFDDENDDNDEEYETEYSQHDDESPVVAAQVADAVLPNFNNLKIQSPFSAPASPELKAIKERNEEDLKQLMTSPGSSTSSLDESPLHPKTMEFGEKL